MARQTALDWLERQVKLTYDNEGKLPLAYTLNLIKQAKKMERKQLLIEIMQEDERDGLYEDNMCIVCNGSGEGMYDGSTCSSCKGLGVKIKEL